MMILICSAGWHQAQDLMNEAQSNYENCHRELEYGVTSYSIENLERKVAWYQGVLGEVTVRVGRLAAHARAEL